MLTQLKNLLRAMLSSVRDLVPIVAVIAFFQIVVLQQAPSELAGLLGGALCVVAGLTFFIAGLEMALFPLGETMAGAFLEKGSLPALLAFAFALGFGTTVAEPALIAVCAEAAAHWLDYGWVYAFAFAIGFGTTIAEPSLIAVAIKASSVSGGSIGVWGLRIAVALGVALGIALGAWRIVTGAPIHWFIIAGYILVVIQTSLAPRRIVPLAYDSGGVTTSTVTVPLVAALGLGLAETVPGRSPLIDGFGLIAFASLFPIISVMGYAQLSEFRARRAGAAERGTAEG